MISATKRSSILEQIRRPKIPFLFQTERYRRIMGVMNESEQQPEEKPQPQEDQLELDIPSKPELPALPDYIPVEISLEHIGFFTPSSKRIKNIFTKRKVLKVITNEDGSKRTIEVIISANHELGLPITSDQDYNRAFYKILDEAANKDGQLRLPIAVPTKKLIRYTGKKTTLKTRKEAREWLERMTLTGIKGGIYVKKREDYDDAFVGSLFSQVVLRGQKTKAGKDAETNLVWPAPWFLSNYYHRYRRPTDHNLYKRLRKPIAKALIPLLETGWYATEGNSFSKSYNALCREFLLTPHHQLSLIKQQLDPPHEELKREKFLEGWNYHPTSDRRDWIIAYHAGKKFFEDQKARQPKKALPHSIEEPLTFEQEMALQDIKKLTREPDNHYWLEVVKTHSIPLITMAVSETRQADLEHRITKNTGSYFIDILKRLDEARQQHP